MAIIEAQSRGVAVVAPACFGIPAMIKDQQLADMTISLGSIDPCFSCTDRMEIVDIRSGKTRVCTQEELRQLTRAPNGGRR